MQTNTIFDFQKINFLNYTFHTRILKFSFELILKFKLNMKVKFTFEIRIIHKNSFPLIGHHTGVLVETTL